MPAGFPLLSLLVWLPLAGATALLVVPASRVRAIRLVANGVAIAGCLASLGLLAYDGGLGGVQFVEDRRWIPLLGARYTLGVDGLSAPLVVATAVAGAVATLASWRSVSRREKEFYVFLLTAQTVCLGALTALDVFLFALFWEATLIPTAFLIAIWGGERRSEAAAKFFLFGLAGSAAMLLSILGLVAFTTDPVVLANMGSVKAAGATLAGSSPAALALVEQGLGAMERGEPTFNVLALQALGGAKLISGAGLIPGGVQFWLFAGFFFGFAVRAPLFPLHTWLPDALAEAPTAVSASLAGPLVALGAYGFLRFSLPVLPDASRNPFVLRTIAALAITGVVFGALCAVHHATSGDLKRVVAYWTVSQSGLVVLGVFSLTPSGIDGAVLQTITHTISAVALVLLAGMLEERWGTRQMSGPGGLGRATPVLSAAFAAAALSTAGAPLLGGFVGRFLILRGVFEANVFWAAWGVFGAVLGAGCGLWLIWRAAGGEGGGASDLDRRERACVLPLVALAVWMGVYPKPVLDVFARDAQLLAHRVWHQPGVEDRYATTPEGQADLVRGRQAEPEPLPEPDSP